MNNHYLGRLEPSDPLYEILLFHTCSDSDASFHVSRTSSRRVYKYTEEKSRVAMIGKFFDPSGVDYERLIRIKREYDNLNTIRNFGFDSFPNYVVRPISRDERIGLAVIEEFADGKDLDHYLKKAALEGSFHHLRHVLSQLSHFLYTLHERTAEEECPNLEYLSKYFRRITCKLGRQSVISDEELNACLSLMDGWLNHQAMHSAKSSFVHGDATPTNFLFRDNGEVTAIDLERLRRCDPVFDIGMVCGELKHAFMWRSGDSAAAEGLIHCFLKTYSAQFPDVCKFFSEITARLPFFMALTELRIARNSYLEWGYRKRLAHEAISCLSSGLHKL